MADGLDILRFWGQMVLGGVVLQAVLKVWQQLGPEFPLLSDALFKYFGQVSTSLSGRDAVVN